MIPMGDTGGAPEASPGVDRGAPEPDAGGPRIDSGADRSLAPVDGGRDTGAQADGGAPVDSAAPVDSSLGYDSAPFEIAIVYGHSATVLYAVNPMTDAVSVVGTFSGCGTEVIDIALDKQSNMYATSTTGVFTVDKITARCTRIASGTTYPNSLSFVPAGTLDPTTEALVGYQGSTYVQIDTGTGAITTVGSLGDSYSSSGDIVSVIGGGTYLTVKGGSDCNAHDCLVEVNPSTGALIKNYGSVAHKAVYGLAFWGGDVYGFDSAGQLFEVTFPDAGGLGITDIPIPSAPPGLSFYGAGSTTAAPRK
jgi:hypothetical protein